LKKIEQTATTI